MPCTLQASEAPFGMKPCQPRNLLPSSCIDKLALSEGPVSKTFIRMCCRFDLTFHSASDAGIFPDDILQARQEREAESLQVLCLYSSAIPSRPTTCTVPGSTRMCLVTTMTACRLELQLRDTYSSTMCVCASGTDFGHNAGDLPKQACGIVLRWYMVH